MATRIVAWVDALGNLVRFALPPGQRHDIVGVAPLIDGVRLEALPGDEAFDADRLRAGPDTRGATAVIPPKSNRKATIDHDKVTYRWRHPIENHFAELDEFRAAATRHDKTDDSFRANINRAAAMIAAR